MSSLSKEALDGDGVGCCGCRVKVISVAEAVPEGKALHGISFSFCELGCAGVTDPVIEADVGGVEATEVVVVEVVDVITKVEGEEEDGTVEVEEEEVTAEEEEEKGILEEAEKGSTVERD